MRYRSRNDIFASILQSAQKEENGIKITRIMYIPTCRTLKRLNF